MIGYIDYHRLPLTRSYSKNNKLSLMIVGPGLYMYDVVVKRSRSLSHLLMSSCIPSGATVAKYGDFFIFIHGGRLSSWIFMNLKFYKPILLRRSTCVIVPICRLGLYVRQLIRYCNVSIFNL